MTTPAVLDPREARPLTSREISKVLCSIIGGVITTEPKTRDRVPKVLRLAKTSPQDLMAQTTRPLLDEKVLGRVPSWECAFAATVSGLRGWCAPQDIDTAIDWVDQNLPLILGSLTARLPS